MFINLQNKFTDRLVGYKEHFHQLPLCHPLLIAKLRNRIPNRFISISPVKLKMLRFAIYHYSTPKNIIPIPNTSQYYHLIVLFHPPVPVLFALGNYWLNVLLYHLQSAAMYSRYHRAYLSVQSEAVSHFPMPDHKKQISSHMYVTDGDYL